MNSTFTSLPPPSFLTLRNFNTPSILFSKNISNGYTVPQYFSSKNILNFNTRPFTSTFFSKSTANGCTLRQVILSATRDRLQLLVSEFESLTEPIERVKRLLEYAARLPPSDHSARCPANKVTGCTTQVWLEVSMDKEGKMRFRGDSDSEITKGFIWCLIYVLDGAEPEEVVAVKPEEMVAINVGLYGKQQSRVNTWHNVLTAMQNRTKDLIGRQNFLEAKAYYG